MRFIVTIIAATVLVRCGGPSDGTGFAYFDCTCDAVCNDGTPIRGRDVRCMHDDGTADGRATGICESSSLRVADDTCACSCDLTGDACDESEVGTDFGELALTCE